MNEILKGIIKNLELYNKHLEFKGANDSAKLLEEYIKSLNINSIEFGQFATLTSIAKEIEDRHILNTLNAGDTRNAKVLINTMNILKGLTESLTPSIKGEFIQRGKGLLDTSVDNSVLICTYNEKNRGIGKTTELLKAANKLEATVITHSHTSKNYLDETARKLQIPVDIRYITSPNSARGLRMKNNKFLVDEGVNKEVIDQLIKQGSELVGGFVSLHTLNKVDEKKIIKQYLEKELLKNQQIIDINNIMDINWYDSDVAKEVTLELSVIEKLLKGLIK